MHAPDRGRMINGEMVDITIKFLIVATWVLIALVLTGCRGSKPFGRFVQVTQGPDSDMPEVQPPQQRLATAKPRIEPDVKVTVSTEDDDSPHVNRFADYRPTPQQSRAEAQKRVTQSASAQQRPTASPKPETSPMKSSSMALDQRATEKPQPKMRPQSDTAVANLPTEESEPSDLMAAFSDYPPEVQREALRRLIAATARSAEKTSQPVSLDAALTNNLDHLPELPEAAADRPEQSPLRLASSEQREATRQPSPSSQASDSGDLQTVAVESAVNAAPKNEASVKTVSADRGKDERSMVQRAVATDASAMTPDGVSDAQVNQEKAATVAVTEMDSNSLYAALVKRMSVAPPNESEAERASRLIKLRHLMVLSGDLDSAVAKIEGMTETEQEFIRHQLLGLWTMVDPDGHPVPSRRITTALPQLREATKFAAASTDSLDVRSLAFCTEIESYGQIKPFKSTRFDAGQQVILYCEIENFSINKSDVGFETHLQGSYDVYNANNEKVVSQLLPADNQTSANYLRDYFIAYQMYMPNQLTPGTYRLQLTMEDVNGKKYGQSSISFEIAK